MVAIKQLERNLEKSAILSQQQMAKVIPLVEVVRVLNRAKLSYVLAGAHGLATWRGKARATEDVDVIVASRHLKKATETLLAAFPDLEAVDLPVVVRFRHRGTEDVAIDLMKPNQQPYRESFKHTRTVQIEGESVRIPSLEMAVVMKFSALSSLYRSETDKLQDAHDFRQMVEKNPSLDKEELAAIATLIYQEAGGDILEMVRQIEAGERLVY